MDTTEFLEEGYRDLSSIVSGIRREDATAVAGAARRLAVTSAHIGAEPLATAARQLLALTTDPGALLGGAVLSVARAFAEVEAEMREAVEREVPLFI